MTPPIEYGQVVSLSPNVRRITQQNPGIFTGPGTNTHLVGGNAVFILDPGEDLGDGHLERIAAAVGDAQVVAIIPSHGHPDHWPLAPRLSARLGAPVWFFGTHPGFRTDHSIADGEILEAGALRLEAIHTPGHCDDHLSFALPLERALFPGDLVMGWSTSVIAPPEGNLPDYLRSLERLLARTDVDIMYPAHGPAVTTPADRIKALHAHRLERSRQALEALGNGPSRVADLVKRIYADIDPALHPAAAQSLLAHLLALEANGAISRADGTPSIALEDVVWQRSRPQL